MNTNPFLSTKEYRGIDEVLPAYSSRTGNFFYGNYLFLLDELTDEKTFYAIADLTKYVNEEVTPDKSLNIFINSSGGSVMLMNTIIGLISMAKLRGIKVNTYVFGIAASAASVIGVLGDHRVMSINAMHFVHFGTIPQYLTKITEIEKSSKFVTKLQQQAEDIYLSCCNHLTHKKYLELIEDEMGYITADECLKLGFCDEIVEYKLNEYYDDLLQQHALVERAAELLKKDQKTKKTRKK